MIVSETFREVSLSSDEQPLNCDVLPQIYQVMAHVKWVVVKYHLLLIYKGKHI